MQNEEQVQSCRDVSYRRCTGHRAAYPSVPYSLVTICAQQRDHAQSVGDELVGEYSRVRLDFDHVDRCHTRARGYSASVCHKMQMVVGKLTNCRNIRHHDSPERVRKPAWRTRVRDSVIRRGGCKTTNARSTFWRTKFTEFFFKSRILTIGSASSDCIVVTAA